MGTSHKAKLWVRFVKTVLSLCRVTLVKTVRVSVQRPAVFVPGFYCA